jgi:folate-binding protein YgfZ
VLIKLSRRDIYRLSGADRIRFLNGQVTNDVLQLAEAAALHACALSAKGKLSGDLYVTAWPEEFLLDWEGTLTENLVPRLERYMIADDVAIDETEYALYHCLDPAAGAAWPKGVRVADSTRFRRPGLDLYVPKSLQPEMAQLQILTDVEVEELRIEQGIPTWGKELSESVIPVEAGLDQDAISYTKGCYLGQEVISRIRSVGHVNRHLRGVILTKGESLPVPGLLLDATGKSVGQITSAIRSEIRQQMIGLAFVRRGQDQAGSRYQFDAPGESTGLGEVQICNLPFSSK